MRKRLHNAVVLVLRGLVMRGGGHLSMQFKIRRGCQRAHARSNAGCVARFLHENRAVAAVEFALVAAPFLALLIAILEVGLVFVAQQVLQTATTQASRLILTG